MRKVFALCAGLVLLSMLAACSDDSTPTPPTPTPTPFEITTATVPAGYSCSPYNVVMAVRGGTEPFTWTLAAGSDPLPDGLVLTPEGRITGVLSATGDFSFTVRVTDNSATPKSVEKTFDMGVDAPLNPSLAIFYDGNATVCESATEAWTPLDCYIYIMLDGSNEYCSQACEFKLRLTDWDNADLDAGSKYAIMSSDYPDYVAATMGSLFTGLAMTFSDPVYAYAQEPILVASFNILLLEDLENLSFKFEANPNGSLGMASCEMGYPMVGLTGRESALNYNVIP